MFEFRKKCRDIDRCASPTPLNEPFDIGIRCWWNALTKSVEDAQIIGQNRAQALALRRLIVYDLPHEMTVLVSRRI
jgi:hypothetical protein